ncbi:MAG: histidine phosphatase family protein [Chloroflexota bacterium]|nr:histidine phosphatase family protein [Chloroflexota bacterium]
MGTWYLVRHGETEWNRTGRMQGHLGVPLNAEGRRQATRLAGRLRRVEFSAIYASDLARAAETAQIIADGRDLAVTPDSDLREFSGGEWEGLTLEEIERRYPGLLAERIEAGGNMGWSAPGGESAIDALQRVRRFSTRAKASLDAGENILVVAHGGTLRALVVCLLDLADTDFWKFQVDNTALAIISDHDGSRVLESWNDTHHLANADSSDRV